MSFGSFFCQYNVFTLGFQGFRRRENQKTGRETSECSTVLRKSISGYRSRRLPPAKKHTHFGSVTASATLLQNAALSIRALKHRGTFPLFTFPPFTAAKVEKKLAPHRLELIQFADEAGIGRFNALDSLNDRLTLGEKPGNRERHRNAVIAE